MSSERVTNQELIDQATDRAEEHAWLRGRYARRGRILRQVLNELPIGTPLHDAIVEELRERRR